MARRATAAEVDVQPLARGRRPTASAIMRSAIASSCLRRSGMLKGSRPRVSSSRFPNVLRPNWTAIPIQLFSATLAEMRLNRTLMERSIYLSLLSPAGGNFASANNQPTAR